MRPNKLIEYWSRRPLDRAEFLSMIERNYNIKGFWSELTEWLDAFSGLIPFIIEWRQSDIEFDYVTRERINLTPIEYLFYLPQNTIEPYISGLEDWYLNRRVPSDMPDSEREGIMTLISNLGWNVLCPYLNNDGETGLEIENANFEEWGYLQLEYTGPKIYPYSALNYPGGSIFETS